MLFKNVIVSKFTIASRGSVCYSTAFLFSTSVSFAVKIKFLSLQAEFIADRTARQYDRLLASSCRLSVCPSVCLSVCDAVHCASAGYRAKSCTSVSLTGKFPFVSLEYSDITGHTKLYIVYAINKTDL